MELLMRFNGQGLEQLDRTVASLDKVATGSAKTAPALTGVERALGGVNQEASRAGRSFDGLADKVRNGLQSPMQSATGAVESLLGGMGKFGAITAAAAVGIGIVAKQAYDLVSSLGAAAEQSVNFADRLGIAIGRAEQLQAQAEIAGVNISALEGAVRILAAALEDPAGSGAKTVGMLRELGVATHEVSGKQRELGGVLLDVVERLSRIESDSERVLAAQRTLGKSAATELLPWIKNLDELEEAVKRIGVGMDPALTEKLAKADDKFGELKKRLEEIKKILVEPLISPMVDLLDHMMGNNIGRQRTGGRQYFDEADQWKPGDYAGPRIRIITPESQLEDAYRKRRGQTEDGQRRLMAELQKQIAEQEAIIFGKGAGIDAKRSAVQEAERLEAKVRQIEARLKSATGGNKDTGVLKLSDLLAKGNGKERRPTPSLYSLEERSNVFAGLNPDGSFTAKPVENDAKKAQEKAFADGLLANLKLREDIAKRTAQIEVDAAIRLLELSDNEYESAVRIRDLKIATAKDSAEARQAELDYAIRIEEIEKRRLEKYKDTAGRVWDSMKSNGRGGLRDMLTGQWDILQRQVFVNSSSRVFEKAGGFLGQIGASSGLPGWLLEGTIFDPKNAQKPIDANTKSLDRLRTSVDKLTAKIGGGSVPGGIPGMPNIPGLDAAGLIIDESGAFGGSKEGGWFGKLGQKVYGSNAGKNASAFMGGFGSLFSAGLFAGARRGDFSVPLGDGKATTASALGASWRIGNIAASGAAVGLGTLGIISGLREGGAGGAVTAAGSALGMAAMIPGPQQPFMQAAAMVAGLVKGLLPNPKESFDKEQFDTLNSRRYAVPEAQTQAYDFATGSDMVDYDYRGRTRVIVNRPVQVSITAFDSRSFLDRRDDIAAAVHDALDAGHPLGDGVQKVIFGAV
jgi:hypothetical protein